MTSQGRCDEECWAPTREALSSPAGEVRRRVLFGFVLFVLFVARQQHHKTTVRTSLFFLFFFCSLVSRLF